MRRRSASRRWRRREPCVARAVARREAQPRAAGVPPAARGGHARPSSSTASTARRTMRTQRSREALEDGRALALQAVAGGAAEQGGLLFESAAEIGRRAAHVPATPAQEVDAEPPSHSRALRVIATRRLYDPNPIGVSDLVVINGASPDDAARAGRYRVLSGARHDLSRAAAGASPARSATRISIRSRSSSSARTA